jgi:hypothetical protein
MTLRKQRIDSVQLQMLGREQQLGISHGQIVHLAAIHDWSVRSSHVSEVSFACVIHVKGYWTATYSSYTPLHL